jgi:hypothetical protein
LHFFGLCIQKQLGDRLKATDFNRPADLEIYARFACPADGYHDGY